MRRDLVGYGIFVFLGIGAAWWATLPQKEGDSSRIDVLKIEPKQVTSVSYESSDIKVFAQRDGERFWITQTTAPKAPAPGQPVPPSPKPERFLANEQFQEVLSWLNPLTALRVVGTPKSDELKDFGLGEDAASLSFQVGETGYTFKIGKILYGSSNRFMLDGRDGRVLLVEGRVIDLVAKARQRMFENRIVKVDFAEIDRIEVRTDGKSKRIAKVVKGTDGAVQWGDDTEGASEKPAYASWVDKLAKLRLYMFPELESLGELDKADEVMTVVLESKGKPVETLVMRKTTEMAPNPDAQKNGKSDPRKAPTEISTSIYYVKSDFLGGYAKVWLDRAQPLVKDLVTLF